MRRWGAILFAAAAVVLSSGIAEAGFLSPLERGPMPAIRLPGVQVERLPNGILCFLKEDHTIPIVKMQAIVRAGSIYDSAKVVGRAELAGILMRSGGAGERSPEAFDAAVDDLGAVLTAGIGAEMGQFGLQVLSEDVEKGLGLFFDMLFAPRFDEERLGVARLKIEERLRREDDDPGSLAARHYRQLVYGVKSVWARRPDRSTLRGITAEEVRRLHRQFFTTNNVMLAVAGDFDTKSILALIRRLTEDALSGEVQPPPVPEVALSFLPAREDVVRPLTQAFIRMGHLGIRRHNPDKYALLLATDILGAGNFKSRLMEDIRTKRGMAYNVWSNLSPGTDYGLFTVGVGTKEVQAEQVIELIRAHIERLATDGDVTAEELEFARRSVLTQLIFEFDSAFKIVSRRAFFRFFGYPDDYWSVFRDQIAKVSRSDVKDVAHRYLHPDGLKVVVVGPKAKNK